MTSFDALNAIKLYLFDEKLIHNKNENKSYKYRIRIDIQSIYNLSKSFNIICKYKCILFETKPSILINKSEGKSIKNGFCAHKIILKLNKLKTDKSTSNLRYIDKYYTINLCHNILYPFETFENIQQDFKISKNKNKNIENNNIKKEITVTKCEIELNQNYKLEASKITAS